MKWNLGIHKGVDKVLMPTASGVVVFKSPIKPPNPQSTIPCTQANLPHGNEHYQSCSEADDD
jgi:hypothetical protein